MSWFRSFGFGLILPWQALTLILKNKRLLFLSLIPILIAAVTYGLLITTGQNAAEAWIQNHFQGWSARGLIVLAKILVLLAGILTFSIAANLFALPFNDWLAETTESLADPPLPPPITPIRVFSLRQIQILLLDLKKTIAAGLLGMLLLVISWVPGIGALSFPAAFLLMTFQFISFPQSRRGQGLGQGLRFIFRNAGISLGFGAITSLLFAIPLISFVFLPVAVVGGTLLVAKVEASLSEASVNKPEKRQD